MRRPALALLLVALLTLPTLIAGCERPVPSFGLDLGDIFPERTEWYWQYNNDDFVELSWWQNVGLTQPDGDDFMTFRVWVALQQDEFIPDIADGTPSDWDATLYWAEQADGWYLAGWEANPDGEHADLGTTYLDAYVPFAMGDVTTGKSWTAEANGTTWTTTATELIEDLEFNSQVLTDVWQIVVASEAGDTPLDGTYWLAGGPGIVQWDLPAWRVGENPWQHMHNDSWDNVLGSSD
jgi:hypothetical protein